VWVVATTVTGVPSPTPSPVEGFRAFVARAVGDDAPGTSRFRRALAGESPARFSDRIVLERAAHLVATTRRTLQDIATESGFRGYDVFARAFRREYGDLPSAWRAAPTSWAIDAPGDVHFRPPDGVRLPARRRMDGVDLLGELVTHHVRAVGDLVDAAAVLPDADLDERDGTDGTGAGAGGLSLRASLTQLVDRMEAITAAAHDVPHETARTGTPESLGSLRSRLDRVGRELADTVALLAATGRFDEAFVDAFAPGPVTRTVGEMVAHVLVDADHLRTTALCRLRASDAAGELG
jgi:AraC-like DNA-binding protein